MRPRAPVPVLALAALLAGCGSPGTTVPVHLSEAPHPTPASEVAHDVGELLTNDAARSATAERRLLALDESGHEALREHARHIPAERDPRWLHVLDEQQVPMDLTPGERVSFLLWKAARPERFFAMKAQGSLAEMARHDPVPLLDALRTGGAGGDVLAVALAMAGRREAVPALVERYLADGDETARRGMVEALTLLAGEERRPRLGGTESERRRDAEAIVGWWRSTSPAAAAPSVTEGKGGGHG